MTLRTPHLTLFKPYEAPVPDAAPKKYFNLKDFLLLMSQSVLFFIKECVPSYMGAAIMYIIILALTLYFTSKKDKFSDDMMDYSLKGLLAIIPMVCLIKLMLL